MGHYDSRKTTTHHSCNYDSELVIRAAKAIWTNSLVIQSTRPRTLETKAGSFGGLGGTHDTSLVSVGRCTRLISCIRTCIRLKCRSSWMSASWMSASLFGPYSTRRLLGGVFSSYSLIRGSDETWNHVAHPMLYYFTVSS